MTSHRTTLLILASLVVISTAMSSSASAGPLLSGYGGPGQGNQSILGSALLNGSGGGGGGSGRGSSPAASSSISPTSSGVPAGGARTASPRSHAHLRPGEGKQAAGTIGQASDGSFGTYPVSERSGAAQSAIADSGTLGLSGADLLYALLALCVLAFTAVLTRRLTRITAAGRHE
jgi:hypothetical protein